jgi:hypothetical protein
LIIENLIAPADARVCFGEFAGVSEESASGNFFSTGLKGGWLVKGRTGRSAMATVRHSSDRHFDRLRGEADHHFSP